MFDEIRDELAAIDEDILLADGFEDALLGYVERIGQPTIALYDRDKCIEILQAEGLTYEEAQEHFEFNVIGAYVGEYTPAFATILKV